LLNELDYMGPNEVNNSSLTGGKTSNDSKTLQVYVVFSHVTDPLPEVNVLALQFRKKFIIFAYSNFKIIV